ncbi:MAG: PAS domain S-box protein, partial [Gammaproteobacteria bacterium]|nr:PAS domain S-box protein [Gammaproteobacteria bacterium]
MAAPLRVLIVEDVEDDAVLLVLELKRGGYEPVSERVETPQAMSAALAQPWDIILSDYSMPHFSATAALELLQQSGRDIPFVIVSGSIGEEAAVNAMRAGASDYIMKNDLVRLSAVVERELREAGERRKHKQAEEQLVRLGRILDQSPAEIYLIEPESSRFVQVNQTAASNLGYSSEELARMTVFDIKPDMTRERFSKLVQPLLSGARERVSFETRHRRKDGTTYPVEIRLQFSHSETAPAFVAVVQDITERKLAEETLFQEKERAQVTLQSIGDAVITTDNEARVDYMNPVAEQLTGWTVAEARGQPLMQVFNAIHEATRERLECPATLALREQRTTERASHAALIRRDGVEFSIEDSTAPI